MVIKLDKLKNGEYDFPEGYLLIYKENHVLRLCGTSPKLDGLVGALQDLGPDGHIMYLDYRFTTTKHLLKTFLGECRYEITDAYIYKTDGTLVDSLTRTDINK